MRIIFFLAILPYVIFSQMPNPPSKLLDETSDATYKSDTIEVSGERDIIDLKKYGSIERISEKEMKEYPNLRLPEMLGRSTSAHIVSHGSGQTPSLFINGMGSSRNLVLLEGEPLIFPQLGLFDLNGFPSDAVSSTELFSGGLSAMFGANAMNGALNIFTEDSPPKKDYTRISGIWGDLKKQKYSGLLKKRISDRIGFGVSASEDKGELHRQNGDFWLQDFSAITWLGMGDFDLKIFGSRHRGDNDILNQVYPSGIAFDPGRQEDDSRIANASLRYMRENIEMKISFLHQDYEQKFWYSPLLQEPSSRHSAFTDGVSAFAGWKSGFVGNLEVSPSFRTHSLKSSASGNHAPEEFGARFSWEYTFPMDISAMLSFRADRDILKEKHYSPMLTLSVPIGSSERITASGNISYRPPTVNDLYWYNLDMWEYSYTLDETTVVVDTMFYLTAGNPELVVESSKGGEIGFERFQNGEFYMGAKVFYQKAEDMIDWVSSVSGDTSIYRPRNIANAEIIGIRAKLEYAPDSFLIFGGRYTYLQTKARYGDSSEEKSLPKNPKHKVSLYAQETKKYLHDEISLTFRLEGEGVIGVPNAWFGIYDGEPENLPTAWILHGFLRARFLTFSVFGGYDHVFTRTIDGWRNAPYYLDAGYPLPEKNWHFGASWEFID